jgi:DNA-binding transcriptional LysR family regulator
MLYLLVKAAISGAIVALISEIARRYPGWGGLVASLPLTSLLAMIWLYRDSGDPERVAALSTGAFWFILPSLPLFFVLPTL